MGEYVPKDGTGSLFRNERKDKESQPDFRGDGIYKGEPLEVALWLNKTREGKSYFKMSIKPKQAREPKPAHEPVWGADRKTPGAASDGADFDDDMSEIPF